MPRDVAVEEWRDHVLAHAEVADDPLALAVGGDEADAAPPCPCPAMSDDRCLPATWIVPVRGGSERAVDGAAERLDARADQAENADDLAGAHARGRCPSSLPGTDSPSTDRTSCPDLALGRDVVEVAGDAAEHRRQNHAARSGGGLEQAGVPSVAEHGDAVGNLENLVQVMRDVDHRDRLLLQPADDAKDELCFLLGQRRGRLVHDEDARACRRARGRSRRSAARRPTVASPPHRGGSSRSRAGREARAIFRAWSGRRRRETPVRASAAGRRARCFPPPSCRP